MKELFIVSYLKTLSVSQIINPLTPNDPYRGRTAPLTFSVAFYVFIRQI